MSIEHDRVLEETIVLGRSRSFLAAYAWKNRMRKILLPKALPCWPTSLQRVTMCIDELGMSHSLSKNGSCSSSFKNGYFVQFLYYEQNEFKWLPAIQKTPRRINKLESQLPPSVSHPTACNSMDSFKRWICCMQSRPNFWRFSFWSCGKG